jgi:Putative prokaryotic signal transducing protein
MITVATCNNPMHAQLLKSVLEDSGIPVLVPNEHSAQTMPHLILAMGGIRVQVPEEHEENARALIADFETKAGGNDTFPPTIT